MGRHERHLRKRCPNPFRPQIESLEDRCLLAMFTVSNTNDAATGSLRQAILNANAAVGADTIEFKIGTGPQTITPLSALPEISGPTLIDGTTQTGFAGRPIIELRGSAGQFVNGLKLSGSGGSTVRGLVINRFDGGIEVASAGNTIEGNYLGTDLTGTMGYDQGFGNFLFGVLVNGAPNNQIGGAAPDARNVISGNVSAGIRIAGAGATGNVVRGNFVGTDFTGTVAVRNLGHGVEIDNAPGNEIGGVAAGTGNLISGNFNRGIMIYGAAATGNLVRGNVVGLNAAGAARLGNSIGITVDSASGNSIGGPTAAARNVISANGTGVEIRGTATMNAVQGNCIGLDITCSIADPDGDPANGNELGNGNGGVVFKDGSNNLVGGIAPGEGNVISGNGNGGVLIFLDVLGNGGRNTVQGNRIGTDVTGTLARGNGFGVRIGSPDNLIGGSVPGAGNLISGNGQAGIEMCCAAAVRNKILGNLVGTDVTGEVPLGNAGNGIFLIAASDNEIGGSAPGEVNVIAASGLDGVLLISSGGVGSDRNRVLGNRIGTNADGMVALSNARGVVIASSHDNLIGDTTVGSGNLISGNRQEGVLVTFGSTGNRLSGNRVGTDASGTSALGNRSHGVLISASNNQVGGLDAAAGNVIAFNDGDGVFLSLATGTGNAILSNSIFTNTGVGIDLNPDGVTANDAADTDIGANNLQNFPVLTSVTSGSSGTTIDGSLNSAADTDFTIQFFSNAFADPTGFGEGQSLLGSTTVMTDASGNANFSVTLPATVPSGHVVVATATDPADNTSEFSGAVSVESPLLADINVLNFTTVAADLGRLAITYEITGGDAAPFDFAFFGSADARFDALDPERGPRIAVTNPASLTVGTHMLELDGASYGDSLAGLFDVFLPPPPDANFYLVLADPAGKVRELDETNNDLNFVGVFHLDVSQAGTMVLVVRGRDDADRYTDDPNDTISIRADGSDLVVSGSLLAGQPRIPASGVSHLAVFTVGGDDEVDVDGVLIGLVLDGGSGDDSLLGGLDADVIRGGLGQDIILGGPGNDLLMADQEIPCLDTPRITLIEVLEAIFTFADGIGMLALLDLFPLGAIEMAESIRQDRSAVIDYLDGGFGEDVLEGGCGDDIITDSGTNPGESDVLSGGRGSDLLIPGAGTDYANGGDDDDLFIQAAGDVELGGHDVFDGGAGDNQAAVSGRRDADDSFTIGPGGGADEILIGLNVSGATGWIDVSRVSRVELDGGGGSGSDMLTVRGDASDNQYILEATGPVDGKVRESGGPNIEFRNFAQDGSVRFDGNGGADSFAVTHLPGWGIDSVAFVGGGSPDPGGASASITATGQDDAFRYAPSPSGSAMLDLTSGGTTTHYSTTGIGSISIDALGEITADSLLVATPGEIQHTTGSESGSGEVRVAFGGQDSGVTLSYRHVETVNLRIQDLTPPTVQDLRLVAGSRATRALVLTFSEVLDPTTARNPNNYSLVDLGKDSRPGTRDDRAVVIGLPVYDAVARTVTLTPSRPLASNRFYQILVNGAASVTDLAGNRLDGNNDGVAGDNHVVSFARGTRLVYADRTGDTVTLSLSRGGMLELTSGPDLEGRQLQILNAVTGRNVLSGSVRKPRTGGEGRTTLHSITGTTGVQNRLAQCSPTVASNCFEVGSISAAVVDLLLESQAWRRQT